jgi:hypothetical protein
MVLTPLRIRWTIPLITIICDCFTVFFIAMHKINTIIFFLSRGGRDIVSHPHYTPAEAVVLDNPAESYLSKDSRPTLAQYRLKSVLRLAKMQIGKNNKF